MRPHRRPTARLAALAVLAGCALAACATHRPSPRAVLEEYLTHARPPVDKFEFNRFQSWEGVDADHVVLWLDMKTAYLIGVAGCPELQFSFSGLGVSSLHHTVSRYDSLFPGQGARCAIQDIRPIDVASLRADRAAARARAAEAKVSGRVD